MRSLLPTKFRLRSCCRRAPRLRSDGMNGEKGSDDRGRRDSDDDDDARVSMVGPDDGSGVVDECLAWERQRVPLLLVVAA